MFVQVVCCDESKFQADIALGIFHVASI
jgi:hypothetical protein